MPETKPETVIKFNYDNMERGELDAQIQVRIDKLTELKFKLQSDGQNNQGIITMIDRCLQRLQSDLSNNEKNRKLTLAYFKTWLEIQEEDKFSKLHGLLKEAHLVKPAPAQPTLDKKQQENQTKIGTLKPKIEQTMPISEVTNTFAETKTESKNISDTTRKEILSALQAEQQRLMEKYELTPATVKDRMVITATREQDSKISSEITKVAIDRMNKIGRLISSLAQITTQDTMLEDSHQSLGKHVVQTAKGLASTALKRFIGGEKAQEEKKITRSSSQSSSTKTTTPSSKYANNFSEKDLYDKLKTLKTEMKSTGRWFGQIARNNRFFSGEQTNLDKAIKLVTPKGPSIMERINRGFKRH